MLPARDCIPPGAVTCKPFSQPRVLHPDRPAILRPNGAVMKKSSSLTIALAVTAALMGGAAWAAPAQTQEVTQRDLNQQDRIEQGLQSGQLSTHEAGQLEKDESHIDKMEAKD